MNIFVLIRHPQDIHIKVVLMLMAGKHIDLRIRIIFWKTAAKYIPIYFIAWKIVKD